MSDAFISPSKLNKLLQNKSAFQLTLLHLNVRSAKNKHDDLAVLFDCIGPNVDVIMLTETWYRCSADYFLLPGYSHFNLNRENRQGGGIAMLVKNKVSCELLESFCKITDFYEVVTVRFKNTLLSVVYRPPSSPVMPLLDFVETLFNFVNDKNYRLVLGSDFNIDISCDCSSRNSLSNLIESCGLSKVIKHPTRITNTSSSLLDLFITNYEDSN